MHIDPISKCNATNAKLIVADPGMKQFSSSNSYLNHYGRSVRGRSLGRGTLAANRIPLLAFILALLLVVNPSFQITPSSKFMLSCRVIASLCQEDSLCLTEMSDRFPYCFIDPNALTPTPVLLLGDADSQQQMGATDSYDLEKQKRAPVPANGLKLRNILMKVDRIPVGRR